MAASPGNPFARRPTLTDRVQLWTLRLAKWRRRAFANRAGDYEDFYEEFFDDKDVELYGTDPRTTLRAGAIADALRERLAPGSSVLDVGCGLGDVLQGLPDGYRLHGMEYARSNVARARQRLGDRAEIREGSIYAIPWPDASMDAALCLEVIEHIEDDARAVRDIARVLRPGGFLIAAVPYTYYWPQYKALMGHFRHYSRESFGRLLSDNGLKPEACLPNFPRWHQAFTRRYVRVRAQHVLFGRFLGRPSLRAFRWPWRSRPALARVAERLEPLRRRDAALDYGVLETSTFILARKP